MMIDSIHSMIDWLLIDIDSIDSIEIDWWWLIDDWLMIHSFDDVGMT